MSFDNDSDGNASELSSIPPSTIQEGALVGTFFLLYYFKIAFTSR